MNLFEEGLLKYLTSKQLHQIQSIKIGIGGVGGLGSNCAMILARSGFKYFEILDQDIIDASNLNRQQYFLSEIGLPKVTVTRQRLLDINPDLTIIAQQANWTPTDGEKYFQHCDYVVEAFDQAQEKCNFVNYYFNQKKLVVSGNGMAGLMTANPLTRRQVGNIIFIGDAITDTAQGHPPMAPRVTQCAAMMAEAILNHTLEENS